MVYLVKTFTSIVLFNACLLTHHSQEFYIHGDMSYGRLEYDLRWNVVKSSLSIEYANMVVMLNNYAIAYTYYAGESYLAEWKDGLRIYHNTCGDKNCLDVRRLDCGLNNFTLEGDMIIVKTKEVDLVYTRKDNILVKAISHTEGLVVSFHNTLETKEQP